MTRSERQKQAEKRREYFKELFIKCYFGVKNRSGDIVDAWDKTERYCNLIISKEPQNAALIRSALQRAKEYIQSYNLKHISRPVVPCQGHILKRHICNFTGDCECNVFN